MTTKLEKFPRSYGRGAINIRCAGCGASHRMQLAEYSRSSIDKMMKRFEITHVSCWAEAQRAKERDDAIRDRLSR